MSDQRIQLAGMLLIAALTTAAFAIGAGVGDAVRTGAIMFGVVALIALGRRHSGTLETLGGIGDERTRSLYTRASAATLAILSFVIVGWWLVTVAQGEPNQTLSTLGAVFALTFLSACFVLQRRG